MGTTVQINDEQYEIVQAADMEVIAYKLNSDNTKQYTSPVYLGKYRDINDAEVSEQIANRLSRTNH